MPPRLTIAIPFHGRSTALLARALESVRAQTAGDLACVVHDNASPCEAAPAVAALGDPRFTCVRNERNVGMAGNWNLALDRATTPLVALLHDDDLLRPGYAAAMLAAADADPDAAAFFCRADVIGPDDGPRFSFPDRLKDWLEPRRPAPGAPLALEGEPGLRALLGGNFIMCPTLCYRMARLGGRRFRTDLGQAQDLELTGGLLLDGARLVGLRPALYAYRRHANATAAATADLSRFREEAAVFDALGRAASARGWWRAAARARRKTMLRLHLLFLAAAEAGRLRPGGAVRRAALALSPGLGRTGR